MSSRRPGVPWLDADLAWRVVCPACSAVLPVAVTAEEPEVWRYGRHGLKVWGEPPDGPAFVEVGACARSGTRINGGH